MSDHQILMCAQTFDDVHELEKWAQAYNVQKHMHVVDRHVHLLLQSMSSSRKMSDADISQNVRKIL